MFSVLLTNLATFVLLLPMFYMLLVLPRLELKE